jgi:hypothetical protein
MAVESKVTLIYSADLCHMFPLRRLVFLRFACQDQVNPSILTGLVHVFLMRLVPEYEY